MARGDEEEMQEKNTPPPAPARRSDRTAGAVCAVATGVALCAIGVVVLLVWLLASPLQTQGTSINCRFAEQPTAPGFAVLLVKNASSCRPLIQVSFKGSAAPLPRWRGGLLGASTTTPKRGVFVT